MRLNVVPLPQTRHPLKGRLPARDEDDVDVFSETDFSDADTEAFFNINTDTLEIVEILK